METYQPQHGRNSSSFSSSLLDAICDSLDDVSSPKETRSKAPAGAVNLHFNEPATPIIIKPKPVLTGTPDVVLTKHDSMRYLVPDQQIISTKKKLSIITGSTSNKKQRSSPVLSPSSSPSSPGAKIAAFINSLFIASSRVKKLKVSTPSTSCSTSSCLSKKTATSNRSSVRFSDHDRKERRRILMEELMKEIELMEDESDDDDLFELVINKKNEKFDYTSMDELPVYGTTDLELNCAIAKGFGCVKTHR